MLPPRHIYSAWIENLATYPIRARVQYMLPNGMGIEEKSIEVGPNGKRGRVEERTVKDGSATFIANIHSVQVERIGGSSGSISAGSKSAMLKGPFDVHGPTRDYIFSVGQDLTLTGRAH